MVGATKHKTGHSGCRLDEAEMKKSGCRTRRTFLQNLTLVMSVMFLDSYGTFWLTEHLSKMETQPQYVQKESVAEPAKCASKAESNKEGTCVVSTTRYVPAYSTRLKYDDGTWTVLPQNSSDSMGIVYPVWTESNWDTIRVHVYTVQHSACFLQAGIAVLRDYYRRIVLLEKK